jgi:hypothetical protein
MDDVITVSGNQINFSGIWSEDVLDIEDITMIQYHNLYGEAVTISAILNKVGIWKAELEKMYEETKLNHDILDANIRRELREKAANNSGKLSNRGVETKLTEKYLEELVIVDPTWIESKKKVIEAKNKFDKISAVFWAVNSKDKKLNNLVKSVDEVELLNSLIEGKVNGIVIKK